MNIQIPNPCHKSWENMTPNEEGAFCTSCQTTVIDFSSMTDEAIAQYFTAYATAQVCGRFRAEQLWKEETEPTQSIFFQTLNRTFYRKFFMAAFLALLTSTYSFAKKPQLRTGKSFSIQNFSTVTAIADTGKVKSNTIKPASVKIGKVAVKKDCEKIPVYIAGMVAPPKKVKSAAKPQIDSVKHFTGEPKQVKQ